MPKSPCVAWRGLATRWRVAAGLALGLGLGLGLASLTALGAAPAAAATGDPLPEERWKTRPVVVVVPRADDPLLTRVEATLREPAARAAFDEREMSLYTVVAGVGRRNGRALPASRTRALLAALQRPADGPATLVLIGLDGGVKMTEGADADLRVVFAEIDRMPMRRR